MHGSKEHGKVRQGTSATYSSMAALLGTFLFLYQKIAVQGGARPGRAERAAWHSARSPSSTSWHKFGSAGGARYVAFIWFLQTSTRISNRSGR